MSTILKTQKIKQESLIELVKKAGLNARVYPRFIGDCLPAFSGSVAKCIMRTYFAISCDPKKGPAA